MTGIGSTVIGARVAAFFAVLAVVSQIVVPPGFMVARLGGAPAIVVCTGHGPLMAMHVGGGKPNKSPATDPGHICVFAGHGAMAPPPAVLAPLQARVDYVVSPSALIRDLRPGLGLAAPPPPSRGPPDLSI
jgi:hypothetical protein